jgi:hypothetical protein
MYDIWQTMTKQDDVLSRTKVLRWKEVPRRNAYD